MKGKQTMMNIRRASLIQGKKVKRLMNLRWGL